MRYLLLHFVVVCLLTACTQPSPPASAPETAAADPLKVVFVTGDEEYRSEESMPLLARMLEANLGGAVETQVLFAQDSAGIVDPNVLDNIPGLEALEEADLLVLFTRYRQLPPEQARYITDYAESGRPMVGFRTATHAFKYPDDADSSQLALNNDWPTRVFGQQWIVHHGHFADGHDPLTEVTVRADKVEHPILRGVTGFPAYSWLYHVDGGDWKLHGDAEPLLMGHSLRSKRAEEGTLDKYPLDNPVAWTKTYTGESGIPARVFFTTLGHPYDFQNENMRRLALNGLLWALGQEHSIPEAGMDAAVVGTYAPNNSGFGDKFKAGRRPAEF